MASSFKVEVLTPEGQVFADEVELVSTRTTTGSIGIKARHAPLMAILEADRACLTSPIRRGPLRPGRGLPPGGRQPGAGAGRGGDLTDPDEIDRGAFESRLKEAQQALERAEDGLEEKARAEREVQALRGVPRGRPG